MAIDIENVIKSMKRKVDKVFLEHQRKKTLINFLKQEGWQEAALKAANTYFSSEYFKARGKPIPDDENEKIGHGLIALAGVRPLEDRGTIWPGLKYADNEEIKSTIYSAIFAAGRTTRVIKNVRDNLTEEFFEGSNQEQINNNPIPKSPTSTEMNISLNTILYGPPGTGKTYSVVDFAYGITNAQPGSKPILDTTKGDRSLRKSDFDKKVSEEQIRFVTFHQSFSYEEFVEGIRADTKEGKISYHVKSGIFRQICEGAKDSEKNYVLIIDEINRGNISKIFGELITLIEPSKRKGAGDQLVITLPYSQEEFSIPENLYIIGTMNTADRSLALMDTALRRRFDFVEMPPKPEELKDIKVDGINIEKMLETMNKRIEVLNDREHTLGHAFFISLNNDSPIDDLAKIFQYKIIPLLQEYFFEDSENIGVVLGDDQKTNDQLKFIIENPISTKLFADKISKVYNLENAKKSYKINEAAFTRPEAYLGIYENTVSNNDA
jgi:5-methylcytosine-specific restriction endonuclease McrBC GTP-binding regulatory subunit McrB